MRDLRAKWTKSEVAILHRAAVATSNAQRVRRRLLHFSRALTCVLTTTFCESAAAQSATSCRSTREGVVVLIDVSGSVAKRREGWYEKLREAGGGLLSGSRQWRGDWTMDGDSSTLDSIGALGASRFAVLPFGEVSKATPFLDIKLESAQSSDDRARRFSTVFPARTRFNDDKTFIRLAQSSAAEALYADSVDSGYLVVLSDYEQDASLNDSQRKLTVRFETGSLGLRDAGRTVSAQLHDNTAIEIRVVRLIGRSRGVRGGCPPSVTVALPPVRRDIRLLRPGSSVQRNADGSVRFEWEPVAGASTYLLELVRQNSSRDQRRITVAVPRALVKDLASGDFRWTVTARSASLQPIATASRVLTMTGVGTGGLATAVIVAAFAAVVAAAVWILRRRRLRASGGG